MTEKDLLKTIRLLKKLLFWLMATAIVGIGGEFFINMKTGVINSERINSIEDVQKKQNEELSKKANIEMVVGIKSGIEKEMDKSVLTNDDAHKRIEGKLDKLIEFMLSK